MPSLLDVNFNTESKEWLAPFLQMNTDSVFVDILIHSINSPHGLAVVFVQGWLCNANVHLAVIQLWTNVWLF